ncbi:hypothetical protein PAMP_014992 [Pampus punctatissimus]
MEGGVDRQYLLSLGKISKAKVATLKASYRQLHNTLKSTRDSEIQLLEEAKRYRAELVRLQAEVERTEDQSTSEEPESEVNKLRQQLLQAYNELKAAEDRETETQHELKCLWEEKQCLERENEIQPKLAELESRTKVLQDTYEDVRKEVAQRQVEVRSLMEDMENYEMQILKERKELEDKKEIIELRECQCGITNRYSCSSSVLPPQTHIRDAMKKIETLNAEISEMEQQVKETEERNHSLRSKKKEVMKELEAVRAQVEAGQRECRKLLKEQEVNREEEVEVMGTRYMLLIQSQSETDTDESKCDLMKKALVLCFYSCQCLFHRQGYSGNEAAEHHVRQKALLDAVPKRETSIEQRMELQKGVDALRVSFEKQLSVAEEESQKKHQYGMLQELLRESNTLREELHNLRCLTQIKAEERGQKHRELLRAEQMNQNIQQEVREKALIIMDHNKLNAMLQRRILQYCKLCNMIMEEKSKYVKLKQISSQTITELMEQVKVLENETEIQRSIVINKDSYYEKVNIQEAAITKGNMTLETLQKEMSDLQLAINEVKRQIDLKKKEVSIKKKLEEEITILQIELSEARDQTLEGLNRTADYKELKGTDPSTVELVKKIEQLEVNLAERERQLLEKELLVDQVTRLSKPLREQTDNCQQDRLSLAKKMDRCQRRLEQGLPSCPEIEEEWRRMLRDKRRRQRDKEERERQAEEDEWNQLPNGVNTTAEIRPNAYIPQTDQLPLPKPYGAQAPFKPPQPGANMRHIRKPTLKPLEI